MKNITSILGLSALLLTFAATGTHAQDPAAKLPPTIRTNGEATVIARPDRAQIDVGVVTQAATSQQAVTQNAQKVDAAIAALRSLLGASADIKTISYTVNPNYRYPKEGGQPTITGFTATNVVRVTLDDLTKVGNVIDTATQAGSNTIQNLRFTLKDEAAVKNQALKEAALQARSKAQALAAALDLSVIRVLSVTESGSPVMPYRDVAFARTEAASTPIEPGMIEIRAEVALTLEISQ